ncbi:MAG: hypothetical protein JRI44_12885, partial [Deltaproteobacteria bacterium]|nr:hypothetical protein [Deltaproteobacteria bacterium]
MKKLFTYFILFIIYPVISFAQANNICLSCHVSDENETITNGFPIVYNHLEPNAPLAGGNFYWVKFEGDEKGHNIIGITEPDSKLNIAPGGDMAVQLSCAGTYGCHGGRTSEFDIGKEDGIVDDTEAIYGAHHEDDSCLKAATLDVDEQGTTVGKSYRFLFGIKGIEDFDWEQDNTNTSHNEYMGAGEYDQTETISSLCAQCHPSYYGTGLMPGGDGIGVGTSSPWLRHPTDIFLPQKGEYAGYGGDGNPYSLIAPVGRCNLYEIIDPAQVKPGKDVVMCL